MLKKTEILSLNTGRSLRYEIKYSGNFFEIETVKELKICGLWYCNGIEREYRLNITEKIEKLTHQILFWKSGTLTSEEKL
jgi:hypothetical protein